LVTKASDIGSKRLIGLAPAAWARWVTGQEDVSDGAVLSGEFEWVSRATDALVRVRSRRLGEFLVLTEMQLRHDPAMPRRLHAYAALAEQGYQLPVYPVVVNILPPPAGTVIADRYEAAFLGLTARREYRVINFWEVDAESVLHPPVPPLLPFVPAMRGGDSEWVVRQAVQLLRADEQLSELEPLLAYFARFVLDSRLVQQILRWDMVVLRQSPWYQEILEEGRREGRRESLQRILEYRFGALPDDLTSRLAALTSDQLVELEEVALAADSLATFVARLPA
jgi:predicted transposase YdaD